MAELAERGMGRKCPLSQDGRFEEGEEERGEAQAAEQQSIRIGGVSLLDRPQVVVENPRPNS